MMQTSNCEPHCSFDGDLSGDGDGSVTSRPSLDGHFGKVLISDEFCLFSTKVNLSGDGVGVVSPGYLVASEIPYLVKSLPKPPLLQLLSCWFSSR